MKKFDTKVLTEAAVMIALSMVLGRLKIFTMPQGGSITLGQMIPLLFFAIRHGAGLGLIVGAVYGVLDMLLGGYIYTPIQAILDYPLAFALLGLAGCFTRQIVKEGKSFYVPVAVIVAVLGRFICHVLSGYIFFAEYAEGSGHGPLMYSVIYNGTFLGVEAVIAFVIILILSKNVLLYGLDKSR